MDRWGGASAGRLGTPFRATFKDFGKLRLAIRVKLDLGTPPVMPFIQVNFQVFVINSFPGMRHIVKVDNTGKLVIEGGRWSIFFLDGHSLSGRVTGGSVHWPVQGSTIGCGTDVAVVLVNLRFGGSSAAFNGCLHDLPAGTVTPMVWGEFSAQ